MIFENIANISAMVFSSIAMLILLKVASVLGGVIGKSIKYITLGIFFAVFCHSGFELIAVFELISENYLFPVMGTLLTAGSIMFSWAGYVALKEVRG